MDVVNFGHQWVPFAVWTTFVSVVMAAMDDGPQRAFPSKRFLRSSKARLTIVFAVGALLGERYKPYYLAAVRDGPVWALLDAHSTPAAALAPPVAGDAAAVRSFYAARGFAPLAALLPAAEVAALNAAIDALVANETWRSPRSLLLTTFVTDADYAAVDGRPDLALHWDDGAPPTLRSVNNLIFSAVGATLARDPRILDAVGAALGADALGADGGAKIRFFNSRVFAKPPGGAGTAWHRDIRFFNMVDRADGTPRTAINALLLLDAQTAENGALRVVPASHRNASRRGALDLVDEFGPAFTAAQKRADAGDADAPPLPGEFSLAGLPAGTLVAAPAFFFYFY